jgi:hypothetical protein
MQIENVYLSIYNCYFRVEDDLLFAEIRSSSSHLAFIRYYSAAGQSTRQVDAVGTVAGSQARSRSTEHLHGVTKLVC